MYFAHYALYKSTYLLTKRGRGDVMTIGNEEGQGGDWEEIAPFISNSFIFLYALSTVKGVYFSLFSLKIVRNRATTKTIV